MGLWVTFLWLFLPFLQLACFLQIKFVIQCYVHCTLIKIKSVWCTHENMHVGIRRSIPHSSPKVEVTETAPRRMGDETVVPPCNGTLLSSSEKWTLTHSTAQVTLSMCRVSRASHHGLCVYVHCLSKPTLRWAVAGGLEVRGEWVTTMGMRSLWGNKNGWLVF